MTSLSWRSITRPALGYKHELLEWHLAATMFLWGVWFLMPPQTLSSQIFGAMAAMGTESAWGIALAGLGLIQLIAVLREDSEGRRMCASASSVVWLFLAVQVVRSDPRVVPVTFAMMSVSNAFCAWRLRHG